MMPSEKLPFLSSSTDLRLRHCRGGKRLMEGAATAATIGDTRAEPPRGAAGPSVTVLTTTRQRNWAGPSPGCP
jgi:hypothetical protein